MNEKVVYIKLQFILSQGRMKPSNTQEMDGTSDHCVKQESKRKALDWPEVELFKACVALTVGLSLISST